jgi:hypothetical protein
LGIGKVYGQYSLNKQRSKEIRQSMLAQYQQLFPGSAPTDPLRQLTQALATDQSKITFYQDLLYPSALSVLSAISDRLPEGANFLLTRYSYSDDRVRIEGELHHGRGQLSRAPRIHHDRRAAEDFGDRAGPGGDDRYASVSTAPDRVFVLQAADVTKFVKKVQDFQKAG